MTPKQILDSFSETLMQDERILSSQERALVATLLQHAKSATNEDQKTQDAVKAVVASAVGETVAQRAFAVLGGSIVERILDGSSLAQPDWSGGRKLSIRAEGRRHGIRPECGRRSNRCATRRYHPRNGTEGTRSAGGAGTAEADARHAGSIPRPERARSARRSRPAEALA